METHINAVQLAFQLGQFCGQQGVSHHHRRIDLAFQRRHRHHQFIVEVSTDAHQLLVQFFGLLDGLALLWASTRSNQNGNGQ